MWCGVWVTVGGGGRFVWRGVGLLQRCGLLPCKVWRSGPKGDISEVKGVRQGGCCGVTTGWQGPAVFMPCTKSVGQRADPRVGAWQGAPRVCLCWSY